MNLKIGVLGGIGPEATAQFYYKLIKKLQESGIIKENADFPQIIINSIPAPELTNEKITESELQPYIQGLKELELNKVDFIVMVCNTIHLYYDKLQNQIRTPILNLRKEVEHHIKDSGIKKPLIIGTKNTINQGLYEFESLEVINPTNEEIDLLSKAIINFNNGYNKEIQIENVRDICNSYISKGADSIILGCTEFAVMLENENLPSINTIDILVDSTIKKYREKKNDARLKK